MRLLPLLLLFFLSLNLRAEPGIAVLDSKSGEVTIQPTDLTIGQSFDPSGVEINVGPDSFAAITFSNGVAIYMTSGSVIRVDSFEQMRFTARPDDFEFEPSRSQLALTLLTGEIGIAQRDPNPSSEFTIQLDDKSTASLKARTSAIMSTQSGITTAIFDGHGSMLIGDQNHLFSEDYRFLISEEIDHMDRIRVMNEEQLEDWEPLALRANIALKRWYFQTPSKGEIVPVRVALPSVTSSKPYNNTKL